MSNDSPVNSNNIYVCYRILFPTPSPLVIILITSTYTGYSNILNMKNKKVSSIKYLVSGVKIAVILLLYLYLILHINTKNISSKLQYL